MYSVACGSGKDCWDGSGADHGVDGEIDAGDCGLRAPVILQFNFRDKSTTT